MGAKLKSALKCFQSSLCQAGGYDWDAERNRVFLAKWHLDRGSHRNWMYSFFFPFVELQRCSDV